MPVDPSHIQSVDEADWKARFPATSYDDLQRLTNRAEILEKMTAGSITPSSIDGKTEVGELETEQADTDLVEFRKWQVAGSSHEQWRFGVIGEDLAEIDTLRQFVAFHDDGRVRGVKYNGLWAAMIAANRAKINALETERTELLAKIQQLEAKQEATDKVIVALQEKFKHLLKDPK